MGKTTLFKRFFLITFILLNALSAIWLILCWYVSFKDVSKASSILSVLSFSNFFAVLANIIFIIFWLFTRKKWLSLISLFTVILTWSVGKTTFGINFSKNITKSDDIELKVMTWNVHMFDLGEWTRDKTSKDKILNLIAQEDPDIVCLQEFYTDHVNDKEPYTALLQQLGYPYYFFNKDANYFKRTLNLDAQKGEKIDAGNVIFSKYPITNKQSINLDYGNKYVMSTCEVHISETKIINVAVVHLQSVKFSDTDVDYVEEVKVEGIKKGEIPLDDKTKNIVSKLTQSMSKRAWQANTIDSVINKLPYPVILCGDFNDMPGSYVYAKSKGNLNDIFIDKGNGFGRTFRRIFKTLRIDYMFYDGKHLQGMGYATLKVDLSDHYPVLGTFRFK